jgi:hypothetical protein
MPFIEVATVVVCSAVAGFYLGLAPEERTTPPSSPPQPRREPQQRRAAR